MTTTELTADTSATGNRTGLYLAFLQLVFTLGWTTYVIYLPKLAAEVGIAPTAVIWLLMLDQAIFTVTDTAMGVAADRIARLVGRLGIYVGVLTALSCAAFLALPFVASTGHGAQPFFIALIVIWAITSSALRAPPLVLLGKYRARPEIPFLAALVMLGYGVAGAVSPYLGVVLRDVDARLPFVISSVVLLITTLALSKVERAVAEDAASAKPAAPAKPFGTMPVIFIAAMVILALGYQLHFSHQQRAVLSALCQAGRAAMADAGVLDRLQSRDVSGEPRRQASRRVDRDGRGRPVRRGAVLVAEFAGGLNMLIAAQFIAGAAWGCMLMSAISAALAIGETGAEGKVSGLVFSALALATFARMAAVAGGLQKLPDYAPLLHWAPVACWSVAGAGLLVIAAAKLQGGRRV